MIEQEPNKISLLRWYPQTIDVEDYEPIIVKDRFGNYHSGWYENGAFFRYCDNFEPFEVEIVEWAYLERKDHNEI